MDDVERLKIASDKIRLKILGMLQEALLTAWVVPCHI
jgi:hypothetical protein